MWSVADGSLGSGGLVLATTLLMVSRFLKMNSTSKLNTSRQALVRLSASQICCFTLRFNSTERRRNVHLRFVNLTQQTAIFASPQAALFDIIIYPNINGADEQLHTHAHTKKKNTKS
jgi:hypothetical protein